MPKIFALLDRLTKAQNFLNEDQDVSKELFRVNNNFCSSSKYPIEDEFSFFDDLDPITTDSDQDIEDEPDSGFFPSSDERGNNSTLLELKADPEAEESFCFLPNSTDDNYENKERQGKTKNNKPSHKKYNFEKTHELILFKEKGSRGTKKIQDELSPKSLFPTGPPNTSYSLNILNNPKFTMTTNGSNSSGNGDSGSGGTFGASGNESSFVKNEGTSGTGLFGTGGNSSKSNDVDIGQFDFPNSPNSHTWLTDNQILSPLTVLDNINLKTEFSYTNMGTDLDKPPDINVTLNENGSEQLFQFSVSVPDSTTAVGAETLMDVGQEAFSQSLYNDFGDFNIGDLGSFISIPIQINPVSTLFGSGSTYAKVIEGDDVTTQQIISQIPLSAAHILQQKPITLEKLSSMFPPSTQVSISEGPFPTLQFCLKSKQLEVGTINLSGLLPVVTDASEASQTNIPICLNQIIEPFPTSTHEEIVKSETPQTVFGIKTSPLKPVNILDFEAGVLSPGSPSSVTSRNENTKSTSKRKKSNSSSSGTDKDDISKIPSLQTRIQIISQRLDLPPEVPVELINGGHGIKNPLISEVPEKPQLEKLPPARPESDPSKFMCRVCSKIFTLQRLLNRHMKCHSDNKRYICTFCGKGFNDTFDLKRHTRTHTGVRPYKCSLCEKSFTQRCSLESHCLKVHRVTHTYDYKERRSKMYVCEDCGHNTPEPELHYLHLKENHPYSPSLLKFYDKRHFKFNNSNFASFLQKVN